MLIRSLVGKYESDKPKESTMDNTTLENAKADYVELNHLYTDAVIAKTETRWNIFHEAESKYISKYSIEIRNQVILHFKR